MMFLAAIALCAMSCGNKAANEEAAAEEAAPVEEVVVEEATLADTIVEVAEAAAEVVEQVAQ